ncbi:ferric reductase-like protein, putative [Bodo saltans]|uniref:Ferric reductase-like protein, putative n=1 Tax=Bodo saltans TaxID=75058 RepID=A0A0S4JLD2_BODSA|nr:ferric reductase-like protein, putative [Bodo saltans]|eukprot:CUG90073.1 ferric reductase-like protein, putative [Bodo saltans]
MKILVVLNCFVIILLLAAVVWCQSASYSPIDSTTVLSFTTDSTHLFTTLTVQGDRAGSFGVGNSMSGPAVSCYVPPGNANGAVCSDLNIFRYGVTRVTTQVSTIVSATVSGSSSSTVTVSTPLSRLGLTAGTTASMMFAYHGWDSSRNVPTQHAGNARAVANIPIPLPASPSSTTTTTTTTTSTTTTTLAPVTAAAVSSTTAVTSLLSTATVAMSTTLVPLTTPPPPTASSQVPPFSTIPRTTTTVEPSSTAADPTLSIFLSVASGGFMIQLSYNSTALWGMMAMAADGYSGTFGVVSSQGGMTGSMISCYGGNGGSISPTCFDLDGQNYFVSPASSRFTTFRSASTNGTHATLFFSAPKSRFPFLGENSLISYCYSPYDASAGLPVQHSSNDNTDHGCLAVNFVSGSVTTVSTPFTERATAYIIVGVILGAAILVAFLAVRVGHVQLTLTGTVVLQICTVLLLWGTVAVVVALARTDYQSKQLPIFWAFGEATAFVFSLIMIPTTKHVGLGVIVGSSYERMLFLHPVLGFTVLVTMTVHMGGMFTTYSSPSDLFQKTSILYGFLSWIFLLCVTLPAMFLRRKSYNFFRFTHCLFILVLVFGVLHHNPLLVMLAPGFALWIVDLIMRLYSSVSANARVVGLTYNKHADIVTLQLSVDWVTAPKPGSYAFLLIPALSPISHPFTIALAEEVDANDSSRRVVTFLIKPMGNVGGGQYTNTFTAKLAERAKVNASPPLTIAMFGPHGKLQVPIADCRHVVLVSGGIGVTPMMSILEHISTNIASLSLLQTMTFIWVARDQAVINFMKGTIDTLATICGRKVRVNIQLFDTSANRRLLIPPSGIEMSDISPSQLPLAAGDPRITPGRPNFQKLFGSVRGEDVGCYICGPQSLKESAAREASMRGFWIHTETFEL